MSVSAFEKREIIFDHRDRPDVSAYILLAGVARITCINRKGQRVLLMMVGPGMIPSIPQPTPGVSFGFRCEAVTDCEIATIGMDALINISLGTSALDFQRMAYNCLGRWDAVHVRCADFMSFPLGERLALTLLQLGDDLGTPNPQGTELGVRLRHSDLAELLGATRPRVTEHLKRLERKRLIIRQGRHRIVITDRLRDSIPRG